MLISLVLAAVATLAVWNGALIFVPLARSMAELVAERVGGSNAH